MAEPLNAVKAKPKAKPEAKPETETETEAAIQYFTCCYCGVLVDARIANMNRRGGHCHYRCREEASKEHIRKFGGNRFGLSTNPHQP